MREAAKQSALTNVNADGTPVDKNQQEEPSVVIDGPLGRIYTQALNLAYANEDTGTMSLIIAENRQRQSDKQPTGGTYVLAMDMDDLNTQSLVSASNWAAQAKKDGADSLIISLESHGTISRHAGLVEEMARAHGAKVVYSRESAMAAIKTSVKKK
jgi:hypothetical protein